MHSQEGVAIYKKALEDAVAQGGTIECGGKVCVYIFHNLTEYILIQNYDRCLMWKIYICCIIYCSTKHGFM